MIDVNVPLLRKTLEWAYGEHLKRERGEVNEWNQGAWMMRTRTFAHMTTSPISVDEVDAAVRAGTACGTACCIAGKVALDEGWQMMNSLGTHMVRPGPDGTIEREDVERFGAQALGLDESAANRLLSGGNTIVDLYWIASKLTDGEIAPPPGLEMPEL